MAREAECICERSGEAAQVKAILEYRELILRGGMSRRFPFAAMRRVQAHHGQLCFEFKAEQWSLAIGGEMAAKWAGIILTPPASLAKKMGITGELTVELAGEVDDKALEDALAEAKTVIRHGGELIVARVDAAQELAQVLKAKAQPLENGVPLWVVFPKGRGHEINERTIGEHDVRELCLAAGLVDHKVTAVSDALTALRFVKRRNAAEGRA
jgi:hypothetical protein